MSRHTVHISNMNDTSVTVKVTATASGFEVDTITTVAGMLSKRHVGVYGEREHAVASAKTEAARVAAAFLQGVAP